MQACRPMRGRPGARRRRAHPQPDTASGVSSVPVLLRGRVLLPAVAPKQQDAVGPQRVHARAVRGAAQQAASERQAGGSARAGGGRARGWSGLGGQQQRAKAVHSMSLQQACVGAGPAAGGSAPRAPDVAHQPRGAEGAGLRVKHNHILEDLISCGWWVGAGWRAASRAGASAGFQAQACVARARLGSQAPSSSSGGLAPACTQPQPAAHPPAWCRRRPRSRPPAPPAWRCGSCSQGGWQGRKLEARPASPHRLSATQAGTLCHPTRLRGTEGQRWTSCSHVRACVS